MATPDQSQTSGEYLEELVTCSICFGIFQHPVCLQPCTHKFCLACIEMMLKDYDSKGTCVLCPICRKPVVSYAPDHTFQKVVDLYRRDHQDETDGQEEVCNTGVGGDRHGSAHCEDRCTTSSCRERSQSYPSNSVCYIGARGDTGVQPAAEELGARRGEELGARRGEELSGGQCVAAVVGACLGGFVGGARGAVFGGAVGAALFSSSNTNSTTNRNR